MKERIALTNAERIGDKVKLTFSDGDEFFVKYEDFNRTTISFINGNKDELKRDFAIDFKPCHKMFP